MRLTTQIVLGCLLAAAGSPASADSMQELTAEGLTLAAPDLELAAEGVSISMTAVEFKYELVNKADHPATLDITIRLPPLDMANPDIAYAIPSSDLVNYTGAQLVIDGAPSTPTFRQTATLASKDVTKRLRDAHVPLLMLAQSDIQRALAALPPETLKDLIQDGLLTPNGSSPDGPSFFQPTWTVKTWGVRRQHVAAGQRTVVELHTQASVGSSPDTVLRKALRQNADLQPEADRIVRDYCIEDVFLRGLDKQAGVAEDNTAQLQERRIDVVLPPALGSDAPVPAFRLTLDKGKPDSLISTCTDKLKKVGPTLFEADLTDTAPPRRFRVLFVGKF